MIENIQWGYMLTVRAPDLENQDEVYRAIQREIIRPLSELLSDPTRGCKLSGLGVTTTHHGRHAHILLHSTKPLPTICHRSDPAGYEHIRRLIDQTHKIKRCLLPGGKNAIELTPIIDQAGAANYIDRHYARYHDAQDLTFNQRQLQRLYGQLRAA